MKLLFIHEVNWSTKVTFEIQELPELLSLRGHDIDFIDFDEGSKHTGLGRFLKLRTRIRQHRSHTYHGSVVRVMTPGRVTPPPLDRLVASLTFVPLLVRCLKSEKYDAIVLYAVPTNGWQTVVIARMFRVPVLYRGLDVSHEIRRSVFRPLIKLAERFVYRRADWTSVNNAELAGYCIALGADADRCSVDFAGLDPSVFQSPSSRAVVRQRLGLDRNARVIIYLGSLFVFCGIARVIDELAEFAGAATDIRLLIAGDGDLAASLRSQVDDMGLGDRVMFVGRIRFDEIADYLAAADVGIIPFERLQVSHLAFPWKSVQYLAAGLPIVASDLRGLRTVFPEGAGVTYVSEGDSLLAQANGLCDDDASRSALVDSGRRIVYDHFLWSNNVRTFENLLKALAGLDGDGS